MHDLAEDQDLQTLEVLSTGRPEEYEAAIPAMRELYPKLVKETPALSSRQER